MTVLLNNEASDVEMPDVEEQLPEPISSPAPVSPNASEVVKFVTKTGVEVVCSACPFIQCTNFLILVFLSLSLKHDSG
jgi:hypothetical protein